MGVRNGPHTLSPSVQRLQSMSQLLARMLPRRTPAVMVRPLTERQQMFDASARRGATYFNIGGIVGIYSGHDREDGSGFCFNVRLNVNGEMMVRFVRFTA